MSKKSTTTTQNTFAYQTPPDTQDITNARATVQDVDFSSPIISAYGQLANQLGDDRRFESELPEWVKSRVKASDLFRLNTSKAMALGQARGQEHAYRGQGAMNLASLTRPQLVQTGGTQTQVVHDPWGIAMGAMQGVGQLTSGLGGWWPNIRKWMN